jgi:DNA-directed RNA polymerase specialized sigma24 family protein/ribosome-associated translation inhibitor RaiA
MSDRKKRTDPGEETLPVQWHVAHAGVGPGDRERVLARLPNLAKALRNLPVRVVHLEVDFNPRKGGFGVSVSLQLPSKTLFAAEWSRDPETAGRRAMNKVAAQAMTYRTLLRRHERRAHRKPGPAAAPPAASSRVLEGEREQVQAFRSRAARHVRHEIVHDPVLAALPKEAVSVPDVVDEALVWTLENLPARPAFLTPEQFLWRRVLHQYDLARESVIRSRAAADEEELIADRHREPPQELDMEWEEAEDLILGGGEPLPLDLDEASSAGSDPAEILDREAAQQAVAAALRDLPDFQRRTILLHDLEGYDPEEIAVVLGVDEARIRDEIDAARRVLRKRLHEYA